MSPAEDKVAARSGYQTQVYDCTTSSRLGACVYTYLTAYKPINWAAGGGTLLITPDATLMKLFMNELAETPKCSQLL